MAVGWVWGNSINYNVGWGNGGMEKGLGKEIWYKRESFVIALKHKYLLISNNQFKTNLGTVLSVVSSSAVVAQTGQKRNRGQARKICGSVASPGSYWRCSMGLMLQRKAPNTRKVGQTLQTMWMKESGVSPFYMNLELITSLGPLFLISCVSLSCTLFEVLLVGYARWTLVSWVSFILFLPFLQVLQLLQLQFYILYSILVTIVRLQ